jgi:hypothetical protein
MRFLAIAFLAHGGQHRAEYSHRALKVHTRFLAPLKRIDCALIAVLRCSSLSTVVMSASSTCFSRIRHHAALLSAADRCQLPRQLPRAQSFAIDYHLFSPVSRAFLCSLSLAGTGGPVGVAWYLRPLWRRRQRLCCCASCAPAGDLLLFRGVVCADLCARHPATFASFSCRAVPSFVRGALQLWQPRLRRACVRGGSVVPTSAASGRRVELQLFCRRAPRVGAFYRHHRFALRCPCCAPSSPISELWFLSRASCDGFAAAVLLSIGLAVQSRRF